LFLPNSPDRTLWPALNAVVICKPHATRKSLKSWEAVCRAVIVRRQRGGFQPLANPLLECLRLANEVVDFCETDNPKCLCIRARKILRLVIAPD